MAYRWHTDGVPMTYRWRTDGIPMTSIPPQRLCKLLSDLCDNAFAGFAASLCSLRWVYWWDWDIYGAPVLTEMSRIWLWLRRDLAYTWPC